MPTRESFKKIHLVDKFSIYRVLLLTFQAFNVSQTQSRIKFRSTATSRLPSFLSSCRNTEIAVARLLRWVGRDTVKVKCLAKERNTMTMLRHGRWNRPQFYLDDRCYYIWKLLSRDCSDDYKYTRMHCVVV